MDAYRRADVKEYLVWRVEDREFDWFLLREGDYIRVAPDADGTCVSRTSPDCGWRSRRAGRRYGPGHG